MIQPRTCRADGCENLTRRVKREWFCSIKRRREYNRQRCEARRAECVDKAMCLIKRKEFLPVLAERDVQPYTHREYVAHTGHVGSTPKTRLAIATGYIYEKLGRARLNMKMTVLADTLTESEWDELLAELLGDEYSPARKGSTALLKNPRGSGAVVGLLPSG